MSGGWWSVIVLSVAASVPGAVVLAQQDEGPVLRPKKPAAKPAASATLLVICDLDCTWNLDGEAKGRKTTVGVGQHVVVAMTEDGADQIKQISEAKTGGQAVVNVELRPLRVARLKVEQQAKDKADKEAREKAAQDERERVAREQQEREQKDRDQVAKERQEKHEKVTEQTAQAEADGRLAVADDRRVGGNPRRQR